MHPPTFLLSHKLSTWPECFLEIRCERCEQRRLTIAVKGLMRWYGDRTFREIISRLRCKYCRRRPAVIHLQAFQKIVADGDPAVTWSLEIVTKTT
jgi:hypothetical protein